jgi:hypothetical protein
MLPKQDEWDQFKSEGFPPEATMVLAAVSLRLSTIAIFLSLQ